MPMQDDILKLEDFLPYRLYHLADLVSREFSKIYRDRLGLTRPEWRTLAVVQYLGKPSLRAVARATQQDEGQLSRYVAGLIKRGLLTKTVSSEDRRSIDLTLTDEARKLYDEVMMVAWELNREMFVDLSEDEQRQLVQLLDKLFRSITRL